MPINKSRLGGHVLADWRGFFASACMMALLVGPSSAAFAESPTMQSEDVGGYRITPRSGKQPGVVQTERLSCSARTQLGQSTYVECLRRLQYNVQAISHGRTGASTAPAALSLSEVPEVVEQCMVNQQPRSWDTVI